MKESNADIILLSVLMALSLNKMDNDADCKYTLIIKKGYGK